jgi:hypothetical protein
MSRLHICNTFFEQELENLSTRPLDAWLRSHPVVAQLQFLPLLYARPEDKILVTSLPDAPDPRLCLLDQPPSGYHIEHWAPSLAIAAWARQHHIPYPSFDWETIRTINSKVFSFTESPKLPGAALLQTDAEVRAWLNATPGPKVLKTPFGTAGRGHIRNVKRLYITPLIGEPWVERVLDFSTQWLEGKLLGVTIFENEPNGTYKSTYCGDVESWALEEHLAVAQPLIEKIGQMGYRGHIGVDSYIYQWEGEKRVQPVVEINARKTMSWVAMQLPQKRLSYIASTSGLLPSHLEKQPFSRNILS